MKRVYLTILVAIFALSANESMAQSRKNLSWFEGREWLQGVQFSPAASIDVDLFAAHYKAHPERWKKIFKILAESDLNTLPLGLQIIDENIKMNVQEYETRPVKGRKVLYEKHEKYIDVQCMVSGEELHGSRKIDFGEVVKPYVEERDIAMYNLTDVPFYIIHAGEFTIFFPDDLHTTNYGFGDRTTVRKVVFKVKFD